MSWYPQLRPARLKIVVFQGSTLYRKYMLKLGDDPFPFRNAFGIIEWKARMQIRDETESTAFLVEATTENGRMEIFHSAEEAGYYIKLSAALTEALPAGEHVYDVELERLTDQFVIRIQEGTIDCSREVTRP